MAGKGRITVLVLIITAFAVAGCSMPEGSIGGGLSSSKIFDGLLVKYKSQYKKGEFYRWGDLTVNTVSRDGEVGPSVTPTDIKIKDIDDTSQPESIDKALGYELKTTGDKIIQVRYENLTAQYYIVVTEDSVAVENQASGIIVIWEDQ